MSGQQALTELVTGLDHHLLINYGVDLITDVLFRHYVGRGAVPLIRPARVTFFGESGPATPDVLGQGQGQGQEQGGAPEPMQTVGQAAEMQADGVEYGQYGQWV